MTNATVSTSTRLNLGCGEFHKTGYVNVDYYALREPDVRHNLNTIPYPFADDRFEVIEADHVIEHLDDVFGVMRELHRIARDGAQLTIRVPHFSRGFTHADHRRGFDVTFPYYFDSRFKGGYIGVQLRLQRMRFSWFAQPYLKKACMPRWMFLLGTMAAGVLDFFAWVSPTLCSRLWCYWVGGFEELSFEFTVVKNSHTERTACQ